MSPHLGTLLFRFTFTGDDSKCPASSRLSGSSRLIAMAVTSDRLSSASRANISSRAFVALGIHKPPNWTFPAAICFSRRRPLAHVVGAYQHARRIRLLRRKAPGFRRNPPPEISRMKHHPVREKPKRRKARYIKPIGNQLCRLTFLCGV